MRAQWRREEGIKSPSEGGRSARSRCLPRGHSTQHLGRREVTLGARCTTCSAVTDRYRASGRIVSTSALTGARRDRGRREPLTFSGPLLALAGSATDSVILDNSPSRRSIVCPTLICFLLFLSGYYSPKLCFVMVCSV